MVMVCGWDSEAASTAVEDGAIYMKVPVCIDRAYHGGSVFFLFFLVEKDKGEWMAGRTGMGSPPILIGRALTTRFIDKSRQLSSSKYL